MNIRGFAPLVLALCLGGCSWSGFELFGSSDKAAGEAAGEAATPKTTAVSPGESPLLPLLSPQGEERLKRAKALWKEDECRNPEQAALLLDMVLEEVPDYADALIWRGKSLAAAGYLEDAFDDLTRVLPLVSGADAERRRLRARAYAARAYVMLGMKQEQGAERDLNAAEAANPDEPTLWLYRGALDFLRGRDGCAGLRRACDLGLCAARDKAVAGGLCR